MKWVLGLILTNTFADKVLDERVSKIGNYPSVLEDGHSGCSFGITARACQKRLAEEPRQIKVINIENQDSEEVFEVEI